jgi:hypothetical protein
VRSMTPEFNGGEGAGPSGRGVALGSCEALGPAHGERGGVRWLGTEVAEKQRRAWWSRLTGGRYGAGVDKMQWVASFYRRTLHRSNASCAKREEAR